MIGLVLFLVVGAFVGWLASMLMKTNAQQGTLLNILTGVVGAVLGGWVFGDVLGIGSAHQSGALSIVGILWATAGACVFIGLLKLLRRMGANNK
jgi:uncharacterized membrane protein YeaQ/YmgE (transglycosylase-associated protein family)